MPPVVHSAAISWSRTEDENTQQAYAGSGKPLPCLGLPSGNAVAKPLRPIPGQRKRGHIVVGGGLAQEFLNLVEDGKAEFLGVTRGRTL